MTATSQSSFATNVWYCAGWGEDLGETPVSRRILDEPVLLYRLSDGSPVALLGICPHKFAPLELGEQVGDRIRCGYHGLEFDHRGECVLNPQGNGRIPDRSKLKTYPLVEQDGVLWIWMGDADRANPATIRALPHLTENGRRTVRGGSRVQGNYRHSVENLMDLGHAIFLHRSALNVAVDIGLDEHEIGQDGDVVYDRRVHHKVIGPVTLMKFMPDPEALVDFWTDISWAPATVIFNHIGVAPPGHARGDGSIDQIGTHLLTPETENSTHYCFANSRNHALDDETVDQAFRQWQKIGLTDQDSAMVEAVQRTTPDALRLEVSPIFLSTDRSGFQVAKAIDRLVAAERIKQPGSPTADISRPETV